MPYDNYVEHEDILYYSGRLEKMDCADVKDLDFAFFDSTKINPVVPVVLPSSPIAYSFAVHCHLHVIPHSGHPY